MEQEQLQLVRERIAGSVDSGFVDGPCNKARFDGVSGICQDGLGRLVIADRWNKALRLVDEARDTVTTLFKDDNWQPQSICSVDDVIYISGDCKIWQFKNGRLLLVAGSKWGWRDGVGAEAEFKSGLVGLVAYEQHLYVTDRYNLCIRRISPESGQVITIVGSPGTCEFKDGPGNKALFVDPSGLDATHRGLLCQDLGRVRMIDLFDGLFTVTTVAQTNWNSTSSASSAVLCTDANANCYLSNTRHMEVYDAAGTQISQERAAGLMWYCDPKGALYGTGIGTSYGQSNYVVCLRTAGVSMQAALQAWVEDIRIHMPPMANGVLLIVAAYAWFR